MAWSDYGFNGLDATFAEVNTTLFAVLLAMKERMDAVGVSNAYLNNLCGGYEKIRLMPWHYTQQGYILSTDWMRAVNENFRKNANKFVKSPSDSVIYDVDSLGEKACYDLTQAGKTCVYDSREFVNNSTDIRAYFNQFIGEIIPQTFVLKYKRMLDLMRYYMVRAVSSSSSALAVDYAADSSTDYVDTSAAAVADILASSNESNYAIIKSTTYVTNNLFQGLKNSSGKYKIDHVLKQAYIGKNAVDAAIAATGDADSDYYEPCQIRIRLIGTSTTTLPFIYYAAKIDRSTTVNIGGYDMHPMSMGINAAEILQIYEDNIDTIPITTSAIISVEARVINPICRIFDGANSFQFLDT